MDGGGMTFAQEGTADAFLVLWLWWVGGGVSRVSRVSRVAAQCSLSLLQYEVGRVPVLAIIAIRNPACPALWSYWYWYWYWYWYRGGGVM